MRALRAVTSSDDGLALQGKAIVVSTAMSYRVGISYHTTLMVSSVSMCSQIIGKNILVCCKGISALSEAY